MWLFPRPQDPAQPLGLRAEEELLIGRDEGCGLRLLDHDVSRRHARLHRDGAELVLSDLGSRNGTFVNPDCAPVVPSNATPPPPSADPHGNPALAEQRPAESVELPALLAALRASGGNVARAAALLAISRQRAYRLMQGQVDLGELRETLQGDER